SDHGDDARGGTGDCTLPKPDKRADRGRSFATVLLYRRVLSLVDPLDAGTSRLHLGLLRSLDHRCQRSARCERRNVGYRRAPAPDSGRKSTGLCVPLRFGNRRPDLFRRFPLMVLFVIFCPIVAAVLIMAGLPARKTALAASVLTFATTLFLLGSFQEGQRDFQHVTSFTISPEWHLSFATGIDGLSFVMVLLAAIVTLAAVWFTGEVDKYENAFYACLLLISGGAIGAFASLDLFFFYAFHELALIPTFLLIGIWGSGNRIA